MMRLAVVLAVGGSNACRQDSPDAPPVHQGVETVFSESPNVWFEEYYTAAHLAPDGRQAIYAGPRRFRLLDLERREDASVWPGLADLSGAAFAPGGELVLLGTAQGRTGWFAREGDSARMLPLPPDASPKWSPDGSRVAYSRSDAVDSIFEGPLGHTRGHPMPGAVTDFIWLPDGRSLAVLAMDSTGTSSISLVNLASGHSRVVARHLDAPTLFSSRLAVSPEGRCAFVALASAGDPPPDERHKPRAARRLGIYEVDLSTGARRQVVAPDSAGDALAPAVASGYLYWTYAATDVSIVTLPVTGGDAQLVVRGAQVPSWHPDGRRIGFVYGDWRWADWGLNWDGGAIEVDPDGRPVGELKPVITGYHEDFQPVWSPRGRWIAYHSHRSATPVASFLAPAADDIWLRRVDAAAHDTAEVRLTNFGLEAGSPDWSPDGTRLVFVSFESGARGSNSVPVVLTVDTTNGRVLERGPLPLPKEVKNTLWADWSPVRDEVALEVDLGGDRHALWVVNSRGTAARKLIEYPMRTYGGIAWASDGRTIVYAALSEGLMQLFAIPAIGGEPRQLTRDSANLFTPSISPDGRLIAATRMVHRKEVRRLPLPPGFRADSAGGSGVAR